MADLVFLRQASSSLPWANRVLPAIPIYEKVQRTGFTIQELIISGIYLKEARDLLRPGSAFRGSKLKSVIHDLIWVNVFIILLDIALLTTEYLDLYPIQPVFKSAVYGIKLRLEFVVLNHLMGAVQGRSVVRNISDTHSDGNGTWPKATETTIVYSGKDGKPQYRVTDRSFV